MIKWDKTGTDTNTIRTTQTISPELCIERQWYAFDILHHFYCFEKIFNKSSQNWILPFPKDSINETMMLKKVSIVLRHIL